MSQLLMALEKKKPFENKTKKNPFENNVRKAENTSNHHF